MSAAGSTAPVTRGGVVLLVTALASIYLMSQFLRNSVGVIAPNLASEIGLSATEIGLLSSAYFFSFAAAQLPVRKNDADSRYCNRCRHGRRARRIRPNAPTHPRAQRCCWLT